MALHLLGVELYFDDVNRAARFYRDTLGLQISDEAEGHFAQFACGGAFVCVERKGSEPYPSLDKAVLFMEVDDLRSMVDRIGRGRIVHLESDAGGTRQPWAVVHDPEGHNVLLLQRPTDPAV